MRHNHSAFFGLGDFASRKASTFSGAIAHDIANLGVFWPSPFVSPALDRRESEWRRQWRQPRRKREQNSRFCGHNGLRFFADCAAKKWPLRGNATQRKQAGSSNIANFLSMYSR